jgi:hypothetical protein
MAPGPFPGMTDILESAVARVCRRAVQPPRRHDAYVLRAPLCRMRIVKGNRARNTPEAMEAHCLRALILINSRH